jgi:cytochrome c2
MSSYKFLGLALLLLSASCGSSNEASDTSGIPAEAQQEEAPGKKLFVNNCVQCHSITQDKNGPKLAGALERWNNDTQRLTSYIRNSQEMIKTDPYAAKLYQDWSNMRMPPFPNLSDGDIKDIIDYLNKGAD